MKPLYAYCQISKQGPYKALLAEQQWVEVEKMVVGLILQIREMHPGMGLPTMYEFDQPADIGWDTFIQVGLSYGFRVKSFGNATPTTFSSPYSRYPNLLTNKTLTAINQLWTSDLTYFRVGERFYYIVFMMDVYARLML